MKYRAPRGTRDIIWPEISVWQAIEKTADDIFSKYNYAEIRTPIFEQTELFTKSIGEQTDIVSKEMYTFPDKSERSLTLRPEGTAPVIRACIENNMLEQGGLLKVYYSGPMFRYERPQSGRYRQFYQIGAEAIGSKNPLIDAEVIIIGVKLFEKLGLKGLTVHINSVGCPVCRPVIREQLKQFIELNLSNLCEDCRERFERNPLRILDCKNKKCQKYFAGLPDSTKVLCQECKDHFNLALDFLAAAKVDYQVDSKLVRGLDYYTKTVFEIRSDVLGAQNAICGGGRYDNLVKELGGDDVPSVGLAFGVDRIVLVMMEQKVAIAQTESISTFVVTMGNMAKIKGFLLLEYLRDNNIRGDIEPQERSLSAQLKKANKLEARTAVIIGDDEIAKGIVVVKDMVTGKQHEVQFNNELIFKKIREIIA